jgi:broad specificity phosphatase PhoE
VLRGSILLAVFALTSIPVTQSFGQSPAHIVVVRHAEKQNQSEDPDLSPSGRSRAHRLGFLLKDAGVTALFATQYRRTQQTLDPLSRRTGVPVQIVHDSMTDALIEKILASKAAGTVVVAGHSNTVPEIVLRLSGSDPGSIAESEYDGLYVITMFGGEAQTLMLRY